MKELGSVLKAFPKRMSSERYEKAITSGLSAEDAAVAAERAIREENGQAANSESAKQGNVLHSKSDEGNDLRSRPSDEGNDSSDDGTSDDGTSDDGNSDDGNSDDGNSDDVTSDEGTNNLLELLQ